MALIWSNLELAHQQMNGKKMWYLHMTECYTAIKKKKVAICSDRDTLRVFHTK